MALSIDVRYALRRLLQSPGYSGAVVLMLALGMTTSITLFAVLSGLLGSLPFPEPTQLVRLHTDNPERGVRLGGLTPAEARRLEHADSPYSALAYFNFGGLTVYAEERPRELGIAVVNAGFFRTFGTAPALGRVFQAEEHESESGSLILSHAEWLRLLGGRADAVGSFVETSEGRLRVVGVMPPEFGMPYAGIGAWRPLLGRSFPADQPWFWQAHYLNAYARLDPTLAAAQRAERLRGIEQELATTHALGPQRWQIGERPLLESIVGELRPVLWGGLAIALLVMLVACANVAILVDARQTALRHQHAVAQALGASRAHLYRGLLIEIGALSALALLLGVMCSQFGIELLRELARGSLPRVDAIRVDAKVWAFAVGLCVLVPLMAVAAGALRLQSQALDAVRSGPAVVGRTHRRSWMPALGVALSTAGVMSGGALVLSLWQLQSVDPGLRHHDIYALQLFRRGEAEGQRDFAARLSRELESIPGVRAVALASYAPLSQIGSLSTDLKLAGRDQPEPFQVAVRRVSPGYQRLLQMPMLEGRSIGEQDRAGGEPVAVINQTLARLLFGDGPALGQVIGLPLGESERIAHRIVGVSADTRNRGLRQLPGPEVLVSYAVTPSPVMTLLVSAPGGLPRHEAALTDALYRADPLEASTRIFALSEDFDAELAQARFFARTIGTAALAALLLAALGVYAVAALRQRQRVSEFGLRLAVGAAPATLVRQSLRESLGVLLVGIPAGLVAGFGALRSLQSQLFGLEGLQPLLLALGLLLLTGVSILAALVPALRVARIDAMRALREA